MELLQWLTQLHQVITKVYIANMKERGNLVVNNIQQQSTYLNDTGVADVYVVAFAEPIIGYTSGLQVTFKAVNANTGASTLDVDGFGPKSIKKNSITALTSGDILAGQIITVVYDGTNFQMISGSPGASGLSGYSGSLPGDSGYSGYSGSGFSGYSGSGVSGYSAYSGQSGFSGYSAISGYSGYTADPSLYWSKLGDILTTPGTNFVGTTDNVGLMFKCNNVQAGYINIIRNNTSFGYQSLLNNTTGISNVAMGYQALMGNINGSQNVAVGYQALLANLTTGITGVGYQALLANTSGSFNTAIGYQALKSITTANSCTAVGYATLFNNTGNYNTAVGENAMFSNTSGIRNTAVGRRALYNITTGSNNVSIGCYDVSGDQQLSTGGRNVNVGYNSLKYVNGDYNTAIGFGTMGAAGGFTVKVCSGNTSVGYESFFSLQTGANNNTSLGYWSGYDLTTGTNNIFIGYYAGKYITTDSNRVFINSIDRTTYAKDKTDSPIYIEQDATPANQNIYINGETYLPYLTNLSTQDRLVGVLNSSGRLGNITLGSGLSLSGGVIDINTPGLQDVIDVNSNLTHANVIEMDSNDITWNACTGFYINNGPLTVGGVAGSSSSSATLEIKSGTVLLSRLTKAVRDALPSLLEGMVIYQTDNTPGLRVYNGTNWMRFTETAD